MNNGRVSDPIFPTNGLAQGDGLSPLLFVLVIETLALTLRNNDKIEGYKVNSIHKKLALLADDMILSLKAKQSTFKEVLETLTQSSKFQTYMLSLQSFQLVLNSQLKTHWIFPRSSGQILQIVII